MPRKGLTTKGRNAVLTKSALQHQAALQKLKETELKLREADREDVKLLDDVRTALVGKLKADIDFWYERLKDLATHSEKGDEARARVLLGVLGKILADRREKDQQQGGAARTPFILQVIGDVKRGTAAAVQQAAIEVPGE